MLTSVRSLLAATVLAGSVLAATPAFAQDERKPHPPSPSPATSPSSPTTASAASACRAATSPSRAASTSTIDSGFYVGTWASSIEDSPVYGEVELDVFAGWTGKVAEGVTLDVGVLTTSIRRTTTGARSDTDYCESYASIAADARPGRRDVRRGLSPATRTRSAAATTSTSTPTRASAFPTPRSRVSAHLGYTDGVPDLHRRTATPSTGRSALRSPCSAACRSAWPTSASTAWRGIDGFTDDTVVAHARLHASKAGRATEAGRARAGDGAGLSRFSAGRSRSW